MTDERTVVRYGAIVTTRSSVSHIGEASGVDSPFRREKIVAGDVIEEVPVYSGNAMRGLLRDHGAAFMLESIGGGSVEEKMQWLAFLFGDVERATAPQPYTVMLKRFYQLFSGGALDKKKKGDSSAPLDLGKADRLRSLAPFVAVWGAAIGNQMLSGLLKCGKLIVIARENEHLLPPDVVEKASGGTWQLPSVHDVMSIESYVRTDDAKDARKRGYIQNAPVDEDKAPQQMRYHIETLAAGTKLWWKTTLEMANELERAAWETAIVRWGKNPIIGGKGGVGHGLVSMEGDGLRDSVPIVVDATGGETMPDSRQRVEAYMQHLIEHADEIRALLSAE